MPSKLEACWSLMYSSRKAFIKAYSEL